VRKDGEGVPHNGGRKPTEPFTLPDVIMEDSVREGLDGDGNPKAKKRKRGKNLNDIGRYYQTHGDEHATRHFEVKVNTITKHVRRF
jgi:hypothetical protein